MEPRSDKLALQENVLRVLDQLPSHLFANRVIAPLADHFT